MASVAKECPAEPDSGGAMVRKIVVACRVVLPKSCGERSLDDLSTLFTHGEMNCEACRKGE